MTADERDAFLVELHRLIEQTAVTAAAQVCSGKFEISYPPNGGLTPGEAGAIKALALHKSEELISGLRKIFADASAGVVFHLLNLIDGTGTPETYEGEWGCYEIADINEDDQHDAFLHDEFYESYWDWRAARPERKWRLDLLGEDETVQ